MATHSYQLTMRTGPTPGKIFQLTSGETNIGRDNTNEFPIADPEISRHHARIIYQGGYFVLEDLNSTNGTFVNGKRLVGQYVLQPGDVLNLGENVTLAFEGVPYDPDATLVSSSVFPQPVPDERAPQPQPGYTSSPQPQPQAAYPPIPPGQITGSPLPPPGPMYTGQMPQNPDDFEPMPPATRNRGLPWILAGCGCLTILCVIALAALWYIDANYLWCSVFPFIPGCP